MQWTRFVSPSSISSCLNAVSITILEDLIKPAMEYFDKSMTMKTEAMLAKLLGMLIAVYNETPLFSFRVERL